MKLPRLPPRPRHTAPPGVAKGLRFEKRKHFLTKYSPELILLATRPEFQGRGAGTALVKHGIAIAEEKKLPVWLEASPAGYPLYKKLGFKDVEHHDIDLRPYGVDSTGHNVGMRRDLEGS